MENRRKAKSFTATPVTVKILTSDRAYFDHVDTLEAALRIGRQYIRGFDNVELVVIGGGDDEHRIGRDGVVRRM